MDADIDLKLRPLEDYDLGLLHELLNDSCSQQLVGGSLAPMTNSKVREWLNCKQESTNTFLFAISKGNKFCGYIQLTDTNQVDGYATLGINILRQYQGQGLGRLAIAQIHQFAKSRLLLRKIILSVRSDNAKACNLYSSIGYSHVGSFKRHLKTRDGYVDLQMMEILL